MEQKKRKWNIVDLVVILVLVGVAAFAAWRFFGSSGGKAAVGNEESYRITFLCNETPEKVAEMIAEGDAVTDDSCYMDLGKVVGSDYVLTDLDLGKLSYLATQAAGMSFSGDMLRVTGDAVLGQGNRVELTVDQQALYDLILDVFYEEIPAPTDTAGE